ncbi:MAG: hypothetical protein E3J70_10435 [Candidatus Heimdallarchaeota archaeon]|nr:MAG: hypothetical protein E3J70_10435 [Candidatus Heimdallarchaeota archaeon]
MKTKNKLIFVLSFVSIILLFNTFTYANAAEAPWADGSMYTWAEEDMIIIHAIDYDTDTESVIESRTGSLFTYNLTDVDNSTLIYDYDVLGMFGGSGISSYDVQVFNVLCSLGNMFSVNYVWDYEHNVTVMNTFSFAFPSWMLIEPNWTTVNSRLDEVFNGSTLLDTLADPYLPITYNFTLNDVLNDATSFSIMGKSTLAEAKQQFTSSIHKWTFDFDYSNVQKLGVFNVTAGYNNYYNYEIRTEQTILEFTADGVLKYYTDNGQIQYTVDNYMSNTYFESYINLGGFITTETSPLAYLMVIPAIACMVIFVKWMNKRKN